VAVQAAECHSRIWNGARLYLDLAYPPDPHPSFGPCLALERTRLGKILVDRHRSTHAERSAHQLRHRFAAACVNAVFGIVLAWVLVRYRFPGKRIIDAMVDLPFALPTAVAGIALATLYAPNGWIGQFLTPLGIKIAFTPVGIVVALVFVGLPFVVRTVQPVMEEIDKEVEEAAATLGANRFQTISRVLLPGLAPAVLTGFALAFARGVGEYGSVIFIAGNLPFKSEIAPLLIVIKLEEYNYAAATGIAAVMLILSFAMLLVINLIQSWSRRRYGNGA
jgi:sulfate transport system permease protein